MSTAATTPSAPERRETRSGPGTDPGPGTALRLGSLEVHVDVDVLARVRRGRRVQAAGVGVDGHHASVHAERRAVGVAVALDAIGGHEPSGRAGHAVPDEHVGAEDPLIPPVVAVLRVGVAVDQGRDVGPEGHEPAVGADGRVAADRARAVRAGGLTATGADADLLHAAGVDVLHVDVDVAATVTV